jgi:NAD(P)-dependent dehydrogenase (short-subunit alcohol dehydrogenase family)
MEQPAPHLGKRALVTGASRGIGAGVARRLAADGADVAINYLRSPERAEAVAAEVRAAGRRALLVRADVADEGDVRRMVTEVEAQFGGVDILVNNAVSAPKATFDQLTADVWLRAFAVNVHGVWWCIQAVVPLMRRQGGGRIVNVGSGAANGARNGVGPHYAATKAALQALTRTVANALAPERIIVNGIMPGFTMTDLMRTLRTPEQLEAVRQGLPLGRFATIEETADVVSYLCSERASYFVGQMYAMSAG